MIKHHMILQMLAFAFTLGIHARNYASRYALMGMTITLSHEHNEN